jgi:2-oxoglutarate decarboxylase
MKRVACLLVIAAFLAAPMLAVAQQAKPAAPAPAAAPAAPAAPAPAKAAEPAAKKAPAKKAETVTVTGMLEAVKNKKGKVVGHDLKTETETYTLKGKGIKAAMVGKKVEVTGTESTVKGKKVLTIKHIEEGKY